MIKIAIINLKGGVGKSVTTVNLAAELAAMGNSLLVIDLDKQANTTKFYDCLDYEKPSAADFLTLDKPIAACLRETSVPSCATAAWRSGPPICSKHRSTAATGTSRSA